MQTINFTIDVEQIRDAAEKASDRYHTEDTAVSFNLPGLSVTVDLTNIPANAQPEIDRLHDTLNEVRDKLYRAEQAGIDLETLKAQFERYRRIHPVTDADLRAAALPHLPANFINAIKAVREVSMMGLKEARDYVDNLRHEQPA